MMTSQFEAESESVVSAAFSVQMVLNQNLD
jgi:hypothetical protein